MNEIVIFEKDWGNLVFSFCFSKIDVLPRLTLSTISEASIVNIGCLFFTVNFTIWSDKMREFNKKSRLSRMVRP